MAGYGSTVDSSNFFFGVPPEYIEPLTDIPNTFPDLFLPDSMHEFPNFAASRPGQLDLDGPLLAPPLFSFTGAASSGFALGGGSGATGSRNVMGAAVAHSSLDEDLLTLVHPHALGSSEARAQEDSAFLSSLFPEQTEE